LAIKILSFDASVQGQLDVRLNWTTAYDQATSVKFEVERLDFQNIATVEAADETNAKNYGFTDRNALEKVAYYRLRAVESDGKLLTAALLNYIQSARRQVY